MLAVLSALVIAVVTLSSWAGIEAQIGTYTENLSHEDKLVFLAVLSAIGISGKVFLNVRFGM